MAHVDQLIPQTACVQKLLHQPGRELLWQRELLRREQRHLCEQCDHRPRNLPIMSKAPFVGAARPRDTAIISAETWEILSLFLFTAQFEIGIRVNLRIVIRRILQIYHGKKISTQTHRRSGFPLHPAPLSPLQRRLARGRRQRLRRASRQGRQNDDHARWCDEHSRTRPHRSRR